MPETQLYGSVTLNLIFYSSLHKVRKMDVFVLVFCFQNYLTGQDRICHCGLH